MRPVCLGPRTDFHPKASLGIFCISSASHSAIWPSAQTRQCEREPRTRTLSIRDEKRERFSKLDHCSKTSWTGRPICKLLSTRRMRRSWAEENSRHARIVPAPLIAPAARPAENPRQKSVLLLIKCSSPAAHKRPSVGTRQWKGGLPRPAACNCAVKTAIRSGYVVRDPHWRFRLALPPLVWAVLSAEVPGFRYVALLPRAL